MQSMSRSHKGSSLTDGLAQFEGRGESLRVVCLCEGAPNPSRGASKVLYHVYIQGLLAAGHEVRLVLLPQAEAEAEADVPDAAQLGFASDAALEIVRVRGFPCLRHTFLAVASSPAAEADAIAAIDSFSPDIVLCFDVMAAALARRCAKTKVVWLGDLQFETLRWHTYFALKEGSRRYDRSALLPLRVAQLRRFYRRALMNAQVIVSSKSSEAKLAELGVESRYLPYPWPALVTRRSSETIRSRPTFLFNGTLGALGSRSAFHLLFSEIYPRLCDALGQGDFSIWITGAGELPSWVMNALTERPEIEFLGFVDDLGSTMDQCTAFIAPIDVPVGNRSRLLTCMAAGLPIVADPSTAFGNPLLIDGETCLLERDPAAFAAAAVRLHRDVELAARLAEAARVAYYSHHSPEAANATLIEYLSTAIHQI